MKKISKIALLVIFALVAAFAVTACSSVESIKITEKNMPVVVYIEGQDLNLSKGKLTVTSKKGEVEEIPLSSSDVTISGYSKTKLGEQEVTVKYKGKTTTFAVNVIPRMQVENTVNSYFVGDSFDNTKGRLKIAKANENENASTYSVNLSDSMVTVEGFDSSTAGSKTLTVKYSTYTATYTVNIYAASEKTVTAPTKTEYLSHETALDLSGGYITVKSAGGELTKNVELTDDMEVSGFDPSAATEANMETALEQTVTVKYNGENFTFKINVLFSDVSYIKKAASDVASLDFGGESYPEISSDLGEKSLLAMKKYLALSDADKALIDVEEAESVARVAAVYGNTKWLEEIQSGYSDLFEIRDNGVYLTCTTYEKTKAAYDKLQSPDAEVKTLGTFLKEIATQFGDVALIGETLTAHLTIPASLNYDVITAMADYMFELNELFTADWEQKIGDIITFIGASNYKSASHSNIYTIVAGWHDITDFYDKVYAYCFNNKDTDVGGIALGVVKDLYMPGEVGKLYKAVMSALNQQAQILNYRTYESTYFMYYFDKICSVDLEAIANDGLQSWILDTLVFPITSGNNQVHNYSLYGLIDSIRFSNGGYFYLASALAEDETFLNLWDKYIVLMNDFINYEGEINFFENEAELGKIKEMFNGFADMTLTQRYGFLISVNYLTVPEYTFDTSKGAYSQFAYFIANGYNEILNADNLYDVFEELTLAIECNSRMNLSRAEGKTPYADEFMSRMEKVTEAYTALNETDKAKFDEVLGTVYTKYLQEYNTLKNPSATKPDLGEWQAKFDLLFENVTRVNTANILIKQSSGGLKCYSAVITAYENARAIAKEILASNNQTVIDAYYNVKYPVTLNLNQTANLTAEYALYIAGQTYMTQLTSLYVPTAKDYIYVYDMYASSTLQPFMVKASEVMWSYINTQYKNLPVHINLTMDDAITVWNEFRQLGNEDQILFYLIDGNARLFTKGITAAFKDDFTGKESTALTNLLVAEEAYIRYQAAEGDAKAAYLDTFLTTMAGLIEQDAELTAAGSKYNQYIGEIYGAYKTLYNELNTQPAPEAPADPQA